MIDHDVTHEPHRAECAECAAIWRDLERISAEAKALPVLTPSHDLWAGIEARLGGARIGSPGPAIAPSRTSSTSRRWYTASTIRLAAAASLLIAVTATITWTLAARGTSSSRSPVASASDAAQLAADAALDGAGTDAGTRFRLASSAEEFGEMDVEIRALQALVDRRRTQLDPVTIDVLERNLAVIDAAIAESRAALEKDPASRFLATQLARTYSSKLTLLRDTATMPTGT